MRMCGVNESEKDNNERLDRVRNKVHRFGESVLQFRHEKRIARIALFKIGRHNLRGNLPMVICREPC